MPEQAWERNEAAVPAFHRTVFVNKAVRSWMGVVLAASCRWETAEHGQEAWAGRAFPEVGLAADRPFDRKEPSSSQNKRSGTPTVLWFLFYTFRNKKQDNSLEKEAHRAQMFNGHSHSLQRGDETRRREGNRTKTRCIFSTVLRIEYIMSQTTKRLSGTKS